MAERADHVPQQEGDPGHLERHAHRREQVPQLETAFRQKGVDPAWHAEHTGKVLWDEREVEPDEEQPEVPLAQPLVQHPAGHLGEPVVERGEHGEDETTDQDEVKVRDHEVGLGELPVERHDRQHHARNPGAQELQQKRNAEQHRSRHPDPAAPHGPDPVEELDPGGNTNETGRDRKERVRSRRHPDREHMVGPHPHTDESDRHGGRDHHGVAEDHLARKHRDDFGHEAEAGQHQHVDFRMPKPPEEVPPQHGGAARLGVEEVGPQRSIQKEENQHRGERRDHDQDHALGHERDPGEERHPPERHALRAHREDGGPDVHGARDAAEPDDDETDDPVVSGIASRVGRLGQRRVREPPEIGSGGAAKERRGRDVAGVEQQAPEAGDPEGK